MPGGSGIELLDQIKERNPEKPSVIIVTGFADLSIEEAFNRGGEALISKPVHYESLIELIQYILTPRNEKYTRKYERFDAKLRVELTLPSFQSAKTSYTVNIGRGGMFIQMNDTLPTLAQKVSFKIIFNDHKYSPIEGTGICRWIRNTASETLPKGFGLEFVTLTEESINNLAQLLNDIKIKAFIPKH